MCIRDSRHSSSGCRLMLPTAVTVGAVLRSIALSTLDPDGSAFDPSAQLTTTLASHVFEVRRQS
eukprot:10254278-Alexandrium_andersonii.AAC.1